MENKFENLKKHLAEMNKGTKKGICLALSGGVDSALLLYLCSEITGGNTKAITFSSAFQTESEIQLAKDLCKKYDVTHFLIKVNLLEDEIISNNPKDRCYHCKKVLFGTLKDFALKNNLGFIIDGTNFDDLNQYRPGLKALDELGVISPFVIHKITKSEIREYAKKSGIEIFNKPSTPCVATRFPYDTKLTLENIAIVKSAEEILRTHGFISNRFRLHGDIARIEIEENKFQEFIQKQDLILNDLRLLGVKYITLDLEGLRSGSMDGLCTDARKRRADAPLHPDRLL